MNTETALIAKPAAALDATAASTPNNAFLFGLFLNARKPATQRKYAYDLRNFNDWLNGRSVLAVTLPDLQAYVAALQSAALAPRTVRERVVVVKNLYTFLVRAGVATFNPAAVLPLPDVRAQLVTERALSKADAMRIVAAASNERDRALLLFLFNSGCRVSEVVALCCSHVTRTESAVVVNVYRPKTNSHTQQQYAASTPVAAALLAMIEGQPADAPLFRSTGVPSTIRGRGGDNTGGRLDASAVWRIVKAAAKRASIEAPVSPHWFRHACATQLASHHRGNILEVAAYMGHAAVTTTQRYFHALNALDMSAALSA